VNPLAGAVDTHVHTAPDLVPRAQNDVELAQAAAAAGMRAVVIKSHHFPTADRARLAGLLVSGVEVLGGLALNATSAGGLNAEAVRTALAVGGKVIWLPTVSAANHLAHVAAGQSSAHLRSLTSSSVAVPVLDAGGAVRPELDAVLRLIAEHDAVLATGHLAPAETAAVARRAQALGVSRIVVTHPELALVGMSIDQQRDLAARGVFFERCYLNVLNGLPAKAILEAARTVGVESTILATDLGQAANPAPVAGFRAYYEAMREAGLTDEEWTAMAVANPTRLLGLR
jgi:uncharacterized protein DUF6282